MNDVNVSLRTVSEIATRVSSRAIADRKNALDRKPSYAYTTTCVLESRQNIGKHVYRGLGLQHACPHRKFGCHRIRFVPL